MTKFRLVVYWLIIMNIFVCNFVVCRDVLLPAAYQWRKNVVVVIDVGNSMSATQLQITKAVAKHIVFSLGDNDWVSVVSFFYIRQYLLHHNHYQNL